MLISVWGQRKNGKTHFSLTAPQPIYFFDFDLGMEDIVGKFPELEIYRSPYQISITSTSVNEREVVYNQFLEDLESVVTSVKEGTAVIDTASEVWAFIQSIYVEKIKAKRKSGEVYPFDYADANMHFSEIVKRFEQNKSLNLCLINRAKEQYNSQGQRTGQWEAQQNGLTEGLVQVGLHLDRSKEEDGIHRRATIEFCRMNDDLEGLIVEDPTWGMIEELVG